VSGWLGWKACLASVVAQHDAHFDRTLRVCRHEVVHGAIIIRTGSVV